MPYPTIYFSCGPCLMAGAIIIPKRRDTRKDETLIFSFAKLIDFYRTDMTNDSPEVTAFIKTASVSEILSNEKLWGENLSHLTSEVEKYVNK